MEDFKVQTHLTGVQYDESTTTTTSTAVNPTDVYAGKRSNF